VGSGGWGGGGGGWCGVCGVVCGGWGGQVPHVNATRSTAPHRVHSINEEASDQLHVGSRWSYHAESNEAQFQDIIDHSHRRTEVMPRGISHRTARTNARAR